MRSNGNKTQSRIGASLLHKTTDRGRNLHKKTCFTLFPVKLFYAPPPLGFPLPFISSTTSRKNLNLLDTRWRYKFHNSTNSTISSLVSNLDIVEGRILIDPLTHYIPFACFIKLLKTGSITMLQHCLKCHYN